MLGDFRLGQSGEVRELEHLSIPLRETVEASADPRPGRHAVNAFVLGHRPAQHLELERIGGVSLLEADLIDRPPVNEREQPGGRPRVRGAVAAGLSPCSQKRLLDCILREGSIAEYSDRERQSRLGVAPVELPEGVLVTTRHQREQVLVASDGRREVGESHAHVETRAALSVTRVENGRDTVAMSSFNPSGDRSAAAVDERELVARLRAGDEPAFRQLLADFGPAMLRVAGIYAPDRQVAAEIVQETWIAVLRGLEGFESRSTLRTWVFSILENCARRRAKMEARSAPFSSLEAEEPEPDCFFGANHSRWASSWNTINTRWDVLPEDALTTQEAQSAIMKKLRSLPPSQAAVITLRDLDGFSSDEVCSLLGLSPGNQRVLLHRARLAIRRTLREALD
jgi:RNA polymerase sigma-70 factor, ECF subfamily